MFSCNESKHEVMNLNAKFSCSQATAILFQTFNRGHLIFSILKFADKNIFEIRDDTKIIAANYPTSISCLCTLPFLLQFNPSPTLPAMSNPKQSIQATRTSRRQAAKKQEAETEADAEEEREVDIATNDADINNAGEQQTALAEVETEHRASQSNEEMSSPVSPRMKMIDSEDSADEDSEQDSGVTDISVILEVLLVKGR